jgi:hypothetical protein
MLSTELDLEPIVSSSASRIELWERLFDAIQPRDVAEIGVWKGEFAKEMLLRCQTISRYYMVDPWAHLPTWNKPFNIDTTSFEAVYEEAMSATSFAASKIVVLRGQTCEVIDQIPDGSLDVVYIDGDHTLRGITIDLIKLIPKVKNGGIIGGDDFVATPWQHDVRFEPTLVCPFAVYFAEAMNLPIVAMPHNQFIIRKGNGLSFSFTDMTGAYSDLSLNKIPKGWVREKGDETS